MRKNHIGIKYGSHTMNYPKKKGFNLYQSRHCAYITYSVKTWFLKILSVCGITKICIFSFSGDIFSFFPISNFKI